MGMFGKLLGAVIDTATAPIALAKDIVTLGGINTDQDEPYTVKQVKRITKKLADAADDASDGDLL